MNDPKCPIQVQFPVIGLSC